MSGRDATGAAATLAARGQLRLAQRFRHAEKVPRGACVRSPKEIWQADLKVRLYD
jgi:hypothetical protein